MLNFIVIIFTNTLDNVPYSLIPDFWLSSIKLSSQQKGSGIGFRYNDDYYLYSSNIDTLRSFPAPKN
jgi:hypothetical protein